MHVDRAGHADATKQERDEADEIEIRIEIVHRASEVALALLDSAVAQPSLVELRLELLDQLRRIHAGREPEGDAMPHEAAFAKQAGPRQIGHRQIDTWRDSGEGDGFTRNLQKASRDARRKIAEPDAIADLRVELREQALLDQRAARAATKLFRCARRLRLQHAVEREAAFQRAHLHQSRAGAGHEIDHRGERCLARLLTPDVAEHRLLGWVERLPRTDDQISAQQALGLFLDGALEIAAERTDRRQRRDAEHDGAGEEEKFATARPAVAPRHEPRPRREQMAEEAAGRGRWVGDERVHDG